MMEEKNKKKFRKYLNFEGNSGRLKPLNTQDGFGDLYSIDGYNYALTPEEISSMMPPINTDSGGLGDSYIFEGYNYPLTPQEVHALYLSSTLSSSYEISLQSIDGNDFGDLTVLDPWVIDIETESSNQTYAINFSHDGNFYIDWGDGYESISSSAGSLSHSFSSPGEYKVKIICDFTIPGRIRAGSSLVRKVSSIPTGFNILDFKDLLRNSINLTSLDKNLFHSYPNVKEFANIFNNCKSLTSIPDELFQNNISAENFFGAFIDSGLTSISNNLFKNNINIKTLQRCFENTNISSLPLELFKNNNLVVNFSQCFKDVTSLNGTDVPHDIFNYANNCTQFRSFSGVEFTPQSYGKLFLNIINNIDSTEQSYLDMGNTKYWWYDAEKKSLLLNSGWVIYDGGEIPWGNFILPSDYAADDLFVVSNLNLNEIDSDSSLPAHLFILSLISDSIYENEFGYLSILGNDTIVLTKENDVEFGDITLSSLLNFSSINDSATGHPSLFGVLNPYPILSYQDGILYILSSAASITIPYSTEFGDNYINNKLDLENLYEFAINDLSISFNSILPSISSPYFNDLYILEEISLIGLDSIVFGNISLTSQEAVLYFDYIDYIGNNLVVSNSILDSIYEGKLNDLTVAEQMLIQSTFDGSISRLEILSRVSLFGLQDYYLSDLLIESHLILGNENFVGFGDLSISTDNTLSGFNSENISSLGVLSSIDLHGILSYNFGELELNSDIILSSLFDFDYGYHSINHVVSLQGFASGSVGNVISVYIQFNQLISWRVDTNIELGFNFSWSSGQSALKWYRVQGTCIFPTSEGSGLDISGNFYPGGCDVSNFQSDDSKCVGAAGRQLFVQNIVASNLLEVCQILKASNLNWQVSNIKVYSKPFGSNEDVCNVLSDVPLQEYPECIEISLDADVLSLGVVDTHVYIGYLNNEEVDLSILSNYTLSSTNFVALGSDVIQLLSVEDTTDIHMPEIIENGIEKLIVESELTFEVLHEEGFVISVFDKSDFALEASNKSIATLCGLCTSIPSQLYVVDNYQDSNIFGRFLSSNDFTYSNNHSLQYNVRTRSWNASLSFSGEGDHGEEIWNFVYSWNCTNFLADSPSESYWKFYSFINRKIISLDLDYDTKISINFSQQKLCSLIDNFFNNFSFSINLDNGAVQTDYGIVDDSLVFDKIGLFSSEPFISNPWVDFTISRSMINSNNYVFDLTNIIPE